MWNQADLDVSMTLHCNRHEEGWIMKRTAEALFNMYLTSVRNSEISAQERRKRGSFEAFWRTRFHPDMQHPGYATLLNPLFPGAGSRGYRPNKGFLT